MIAITRAARRVSARSTWRNEPARNGSSLCFVETSVVPPRRERAVDVRVDEVRVDEVGAAQRAAEPAEEARVEVVRHAQPHRLDRELLVERLGIPGGVVEADEHRLDAERGEAGQEREQVPFGAADPAHPVDVDDPHARTRSQSRTSAVAAQSAIRKSHGAR